MGDVTKTLKAIGQDEVAETSQPDTSGKVIGIKRGSCGQEQ